MPDRITPPFTEENARQLVQNAEDAWNRRVPEEIPGDYSADTEWRYKDVFFKGREHIIPFLTERWPIQQGYRLKKEMWAFGDRRISVRFISEWRHRDTGQWYRTHGNEHWHYDDDGLMSIQDISANDVEIAESERTLT
jgi:nuclear transport factor 2 (NTF2) superfamily protein